MNQGADLILIFIRIYVIIGFVVVILMLAFAIRLLQKHDDKATKIEVLLEDQRRRDLANRGLLAPERGRDQDDPWREKDRPDLSR